MYKNPVILNSNIHQTFKITPVKDFVFAKGLNSCVVLAQEFLEVVKQYPIVFSRTAEGAVISVALLGISDNLFVGSDGAWEKELYIPAFIRRYPFNLAEGIAEDGSLTVCVDADYPGFGPEEGESLFTSDGSNTPLLDNTIDFLRLYHNQFEITKGFVAHLTGLNIFKSVDANITLARGERFTIRDLMMVDEEALLKLPDDELVALVRRGFMPWIYAHLYSMTNLSRIINRADHVVSPQED